MKRGSTLFLKLAVIIIGIPILALCVYLLPQIANVAFEEAANGARLGYMVLGILTRYVCFGDTILYSIVSSV